MTTANTGHQMPGGLAHGNALNLPQSRYILPSFIERRVDWLPSWLRGAASETVVARSG